MHKSLIILSFLQIAKCGFIPELKVNFSALTGECAELVNSVDFLNLENSWFLKLMDAQGKVNSGLMKGNVASLGHYEECLEINEETSNGTVLGKYCPLGVKINITHNVSIMYSACIPKVCDLDTFFEKTENFEFDSKYCHTNDVYQWDPYDYCTLIVFIAIIMMILVCSANDYYYCEYKKGKEISPFIKAFSAYTNTKKLFATSNNTDQFSCLNGIRAISILWIIHGHRVASFQMMPAYNYLAREDWKNTWKPSYITGAHASVDSFFFMSAFLLSYSYLKMVTDKEVSVKHVPLMIIHRLIRLLPPYTALYFFYITVWRRVITGPFYPGLDDVLVGNCKKYWWSYFLFLQNYYNYDKICMIVTWYISADMQLFLISQILILPMAYLYNKNKKTLIYISGCIIIIFCITANMAVNFVRNNDNEYESHARLPVYIIGLLMGVYMYDQRAEKNKVKPVENLFLWLLTLTTTSICCYYWRYLAKHFDDYPMKNVFLSFSRPAWGLVLSWVIYSCTTGTGGVANWFLSLPVFQVIARMSYSMYLLHILIIELGLRSLRISPYLTEYIMACDTISVTFFTFLLSYVWVMAFESPTIVLEKILFKKEETKREKSKL